MGKLYFKNLDNEWEQFPTDEELAAARDAAYDLEEIGFKIICQLCNERPTVREIKERMVHAQWTCPKCHTINSEGRA